VRKARAAAALRFAIAALLCGSAPAASARPVRLTIGVIGPIGTLDPAEGRTAAAREIWQLQYPTLTTFSLGSLEVIPGLAQAWTATPDGTGFVYTLRPATWSDGRAVTANDVVASLERARDGHWPYAAGMLDDVRARAVDDTTVEVTSAKGLGALPALPVHVLPAGTAQGVSAGDFRVTERRDGDVTMDVVDRPGRPALDQIVFRSYRESTDLRDALQHGDVDIAAGFSPREYDAVRHLRHVTAIHANDGDQWVLDLRVSDLDVRRAIALAIDRDRLVRNAVDGVGRAATIPIVARAAAWQLPSADAHAIMDDLAYAPARARELVDTIPTKPTLTLSAPGSRVASRVADGVATSLRTIGLAVRRVTGGPADIAVVERHPTDDPTAVLEGFTCVRGLHCDPRYDAEFARFTSGDVATREHAARQMVRLLAADQVEIALFAPDQLQAFRTDNIDGILREPAQVRLVTFWPSVQQYRQIVPAAAPASEEIPATTFFTLALAVVGVIAIGVIVIDRRIQLRR
jgi:peptide/nickel transport system substrate-binding protein